MKHLIASCLILITIACGSKSPTSPSSSTPTPSTPAPAAVPSIVVLAGLVSNQAGARISGATVTILDGPNGGRSTVTNSNGEYTLDGLTRGDANLAARAPSYEEKRGGLNIDGTRVNFTLRTAVPWSQSGTGANVLDMPTFITRVRIVGLYRGRCENFVIWIGGRLIVNEILGTCSVADSVNYDGTHQVTGGVVRVEESTAIAWTLAEVR